MTSQCIYDVSASFLAAIATPSFPRGSDNMHCNVLGKGGSDVEVHIQSYEFATRTLGILRWRMSVRNIVISWLPIKATLSRFGQEY